jgi:hypothetical protein
MKKAIGVTVLILIASFIVYFLLFSNKRIYPAHIVYSGNGIQQKAYSMREIDSISADMNYWFTVKNAVTHLSRTSHKTPFKAETPSI